MGKSIENNNNKNFLKQGFKGNISKHHKKYLGTEIPKGYFTKSKLSILDKIKEESNREEPKKQIVFWMKPQFKYMIAASLVFLFALTVWLQNSANNDANFELLVFSDDVLLESLLIEDSEIDDFTEATLFNEIVIKAELSEQKLDNLIFNNLILEDSLLDNYIDDELLKTIIL
ncbi:hypothetical protein SAMN05216503_0773 [Polaribacter sp. KT25b]|uniref:hypothetical protein n=1 Tax=Polaribacter sp. KT25b TaxID=1855336 RepID=UPI00087CB051|nr:hypothetical protein [Polaribacter sp. KT25b]SDR75695.1 hypothetical protein SAMN05216503_0773 [Polaribacter sp. KT25b]